MNDTGERFQQRRFLEWKMIGLKKHVARDDVIRDQQIIGVRPHHHQVHRLRAEIFLAAIAIEAGAAGRGWRRHDRVAGLETFDALTHFRNHAGKFVTEGSRQMPHRMAAAKGFEIGSAAQRASNLDKYRTRAGMRWIVSAEFKASWLKQDSLASVNLRRFPQWPVTVRRRHEQEPHS